LLPSPIDFKEIEAHHVGINDIVKRKEENRPFISKPEADELYYNFITDPDAIIIDSNYFINRELISSQHMFVDHNSIQYKTEFLGNYFKMKALNCRD
jgi:hypothetical protein